MQGLKISRVKGDRYVLHYGAHTIEGTWSIIQEYVQEHIDDALAACGGDLVAFEFASRIPDREFAYAVYEIDCARRAHDAMHLAWSKYKDQDPSVGRAHMKELYAGFVTACTTMNLERLARIMGVDVDEEERMAS
jgi:hypothetical protein